jgi:hypothetical protein
LELSGRLRFDDCRGVLHIQEVVNLEKY